MMRLQHYTDSYFCEYNASTSKVDEDSIEYIDYSKSFEERMSDATDVGYCMKMPFGWVALYVSGKELVLQIDKKKWVLSKDTVKTTYIYNYDNNEIMFGVKDAHQELNVSYDKSWDDKEDDLIDPVYASENASNVDNDLLAFVDELNQDKEILKNVLESWKRKP